MKVCIIALSNSEIVSAKRNNTLAIICSALHKNGQEVVFSIIQKESSSTLIETINLAKSISDCVILLCENEVEKIYMTKRVLCDVLSCEMINSSYAKFNIDDFVKTHNIPLKKEDASYAQMPQIARTIKNNRSLFQGCLCEKDDKMFFLLPLHHDELYQMFFSSVLPYILQSKGNNSKTYVLKTFGIKYNEMMLLLKDFVKNKHNIEVVCNEYLLVGEVVINVQKGVRADVADNFVQQIYTKIFPYVYSDKDETQAEYIYNLLSLHKQKVCFVEDFTSGNMASEFCKNIKNASEVLCQSYIVGTDEAKQQVLGLDDKIFKQKDCEEIAYQMVVSALDKTNADVVVSNCGDKDQGELVYAIGNRDGVHIFESKISGNLDEKIETATNTIFFQLIKKIKQNDFHLGKTVL